MQFFFDESGDFAIPTTDEHKSSVVSGLVIPEIVEESLLKEFKNFVSKLSDEEKYMGEPKGTLLTDDSRKLFCKLLNKYNDVLVTPAVLDLNIESEKGRNICIHMKDSLFESAKKCIHNTMKDEIEMLGRQWGNLNVNEGLRLVSLTYCFWEAVKHSVIFHSGENFYSCWDTLDFVVDEVRTKRLSRDEVVFDKMVLMWLTAWSKRDPLITIQEIHTEDHPFEKNYGMGDKGVDLGRIFRGNISFKNSISSVGLQMVDICTSIIYQAVHDLNNYNGRLSIFRLLMMNCPYGPARGGPGFICLDESKPIKPAEKYRLLYQAMYTKML